MDVAIPKNKTIVQFAASIDFSLLNDFSITRDVV